jgi:hypothetical protein
MGGGDLAHDVLAAAAGQVNVEQDHVGKALGDLGHGWLDIIGLADDIHVVTEL